MSHITRILITLAASCVVVSTGRAQPTIPQAQRSPVIRRLNPATLFTPSGYTHVVEVTGGRTLYISGQVSMDSTGTLVGAGDLRAQAEQVFENLRRALAAGGATFADVVKVNYYVTDATQIAVVRDVRSRYISATHTPASTFVQVSRLARPDWMIEIEAIAVTR
jgi:reactive intermediate/imine deaminase